MTFSLFQIASYAIFSTLLLGSLALQLFKNAKIEKYMFISISIFCVLLAILRPFEIARDDLPYLFHAGQVCSFVECGFSQEYDYDRGYFLLISLLKITLSDQNSLLFGAGLALILKLAVLASVTSYSLLSLYLYYSIFFVYHDVTQMRVSMAVAIYLLALHFMSQGRTRAGIAAYLAALTFHLQAFVAPLAQVANYFIGKKYWSAIGLVVVLQIAVALGINMSALIGGVLPDDAARIALSLAQDSKEAGISTTNVLLILLLGTMVFPLKKNVRQNAILGYSFASVITGFAFYWLFSGIPVFPDRILQFFLVPIVFLAALGRQHRPTMLATILVGGALFLLATYIAPIFEV